MWPYVLVYLGSTFVDCIPVFAPPAWTVMLFLMMKFDLNPWVVVSVGTLGTVTGRLIFSTFIIPWIGEKTLNHDKETDLKFLGKNLSRRGWAAFLFVFLYSLLPLPTTALFTAAGLARVKMIVVIPPFFLGNLIGDAVLLVSGKYAAHSISDIFKRSFTPKDILIMALGVLVIVLFLVVDWRQLLMKKQVKLKWRFWKHARA
jgi:membrane protein YqaA with SNARE-associated domain